LKATLALPAAASPNCPSRSSGRAGEDDVAREQGQDGRQLSDEPGDAEDEVARAGVLDLFAVDSAAQRQVVGVGNLVDGDDPRPHRPVPAPGLAERELAARCELDVRGYHFRLLAALDQYGPSSQADLGRNTGIDRSDVVATVNDLLAKGYAKRQRDPTDRRRNVVTITARGARALARLDAVVADVQAAVLSPLTPSERATLVRLLAKLV
jgi:DNA-binding MarR family transcriptional regulator